MRGVDTRGDDKLDVDDRGLKMADGRADGRNDGCKIISGRKLQHCACDTSTVLVGQ